MDLSSLAALLGPLADLLNSQTGTLALIVTALGGLCALVAAFLPAPDEKSGRAYRAVYTVVNWIGCNVGKAANADDVVARQRKLQ